MSAEDEYDAYTLEELTPLPVLGPLVSPLQADLDVAVATCGQLRVANAAMQARYDELLAAFRQAKSDRRVLALRVQQLEHQLSQQTKK